MMKADLLHASRLCITSRCQLLPEKRPYRPHLEPTMLRVSPAYLALSAAERDRFWTDFEHLDSWTHMFVNMVLGFDCLQFSIPPQRLCRRSTNCFRSITEVFRFQMGGSLD